MSESAYGRTCEVLEGRENAAECEVLMQFVYYHEIDFTGERRDKRH